MQEEGIPTVLVVSDAFRKLAELQANVKGPADLRLVVIQHPLGGLPEEDVDERARDAAQQFLELLG